jgi:hypothetical protein
LALQVEVWLFKICFGKAIQVVFVLTIYKLTMSVIVLISRWTAMVLCHTGIQNGGGSDRRRNVTGGGMAVMNIITLIWKETAMG